MRRSIAPRVVGHSECPIASGDASQAPKPDLETLLLDYAAGPILVNRIKVRRI